MVTCTPPSQGGNNMTKYELWTMDSKRLVASLENACYAYAHNGKKSASKAIDVFEQEILRRLAILDEMAEAESGD